MYNMVPNQSRMCTEKFVRRIDLEWGIFTTNGERQEENFGDDGYVYYCDYGDSKMDIWKLVYSHNRIIYGIKNKWVTAAHNTVESHKFNVEERKPINVNCTMTFIENLKIHKINLWCWKPE